MHSPLEDGGSPSPGKKQATPFGNEGLTPSALELGREDSCTPISGTKVSSALFRQQTNIGKLTPPAPIKLKQSIKVKGKYIVSEKAVIPKDIMQSLKYLNSVNAGQMNKDLVDHELTLK